MAEYAYIFDNQIKEIVDLNPNVYAQWVNADNPKATAYRPVLRQPQPPYDEKTQTVDPVATVFATSVVFSWTVRPKTADELRKTWTSYEFLQRFTTQERRLIWNRAKNDDDIAEFLMFAQAANEVLSDDPATVAGMNTLVSKNIINNSRKDEILNG